MERDKLLTEAMGHCWHEFPFRGKDSNYCVHCGMFLGRKIEFSSWDGMGELVSYLEETEQLEKMLVTMYQKWKADHAGFNCFTLKMFNPDRFADAVYEFLKN